MWQTACRPDRLGGAVALVFRKPQIGTAEKIESDQRACLQGAGRSKNIRAERSLSWRSDQIVLRGPQPISLSEAPG